MWLPVNLCRRVEEGLAPEVLPSLPFMGICPKNGDSVAVLQTSGDMTICLHLYFLLKSRGWMAECFFFHTCLGKSVSASYNNNINIITAVNLRQRLHPMHTDCLLAME